MSGQSDIILALFSYIYTMWFSGNVYIWLSFYSRIWIFIWLLLISSSVLFYCVVVLLFVVMSFMIASFKALVFWLLLWPGMNVKECQGEAKEGRRRFEGGLKYEGNGSLSIQLDHKWHHCHHLVLVSFHLSAPPLPAISAYWVTRGPPLYYFHGNSRTGGLVQRREDIYMNAYNVVCSVLGDI